MPDKYSAGEDHHGGCCGETLDFKSIMWNVVYSFCLCICAVTCAYGLGSYQWVSNTAENMRASNMAFDHVKLDAINDVSCGLMSFCVNGKGNVGECDFPW